jgi:hypothetical protein
MGYSPSVIHRVHPLDAEAYHRIFDPIIRRLLSQRDNKSS